MAHRISAHAVGRMAQRDISLSELNEVLRASSCSPDAAPAGQEPRIRCVGRTKEGRRLVVVIAGTRHAGTIVTVFEQ